MASSFIGVSGKALKPEEFQGPWSGARVAATEFVHSRVDALVAAGAEGHQFIVAVTRGSANPPASRPGNA